MGQWLLKRLHSTDTLHTCTCRRRRRPSPRSEPVDCVHAQRYHGIPSQTHTRTHGQIPRAERVRREQSPDVPPVGSAKSAVAFLQKIPTPTPESLDLFDTPADAELMQKKRLAAMQRLLRRSQGRKAKMQQRKLRQRAKKSANTSPRTFRSVNTPEQPASPRSSPRNTRGILDRKPEKPWERARAKDKGAGRVGESALALREARRKQMRRDALSALKARRRETQVAQQRLEGRAAVKMEFDFNGGRSARVTRAKVRPVCSHACVFEIQSRTFRSRGISPCKRNIYR